jgi:hypothetical protein
VEFDFVVSLSPIRVICTFEIDFNTENQISVYYIYYEIIYFMKRETSNDYSFNSSVVDSCVNMFYYTFMYL